MHGTAFHLRRPHEGGKYEGYLRHAARGSQRLPNGGESLSSCRRPPQRLLNAFVAKIPESAPCGEGTETTLLSKMSSLLAENPHLFEFNARFFR
jgi:hypothetical protein